METKDQPTTYTYYEIVPDDKPVRCCYCGQFRKIDRDECIYIKGSDGKEYIAERKCVPAGFLEKMDKGEPAKVRTAAKVWHTRKPQLKMVVGGKGKIKF